MRTRRKMVTRILPIMLAFFMIAGVIPADGLTLEAQAAPSESSEGSNSNALKAIGINTDKMPEGFDEDDTVSNPYGKKTVTTMVSDEVFAATMGVDGSAIIGDDVQGATGKTYTYTNAPANANDEGHNLITYKDGTSYDENGLGNHYFSTVYVYPGSKEEAKSFFASHGYSMLDLNLNEGNGGSSCYLGYITTTDIQKAIKNIVVCKNPNAEYLEVATLDYVNIGGRKYELCSENLNAGTNGSPLYLLSTKDASAGENAITGLSFVKNNIGSVPNSEFCWAYWDNNNVANSPINFNDGTSGTPLYLHLERKAAISSSNVEGSTTDTQNGAALQNNFMNKTAGGNFDGNTEGLKEQFAMVSFDDVNSKLYLNVVDAKTKASGTAHELGWRMSWNVSNYYNDLSRLGKTYDPKEPARIQAIAYMSVVTGDFDGNGIDEIAVYNPAVQDPNGNIYARVEIYALKEAPGECDILDMNNWEIRETIATGGENYATMDTGDLNNDGIDDLALGIDSKAMVYYGSRTLMLDKAAGFDVTAGRNIQDASVVIFKEKVGGRYVNFLGVLALTAGTDGYIRDGIHYVFRYNDNKEYDTVATAFHSLHMARNNNNICVHLPLELHYANHYLMSPYYNAFSNVFVEADANTNLNRNYTALRFNPNDKNEPLKSEVANHICLQDNYDLIAANASGKFDVTRGLIPYDFQVADLNGDGNQTVFYKAYVGGASSEYHQNLNTDQKGGYLDAGHYMGAYSTGSNGPVMPLSTVYDPTHSPVYAVVNTDNDSTYMTYTGRHYVLYSNPEVLAVLASPPYFKDLLDNDSLSGDYGGSSTSFGRSKGSGSGISQTASISAGVYWKCEEEISVFGIELGKVESELHVSASFTEEYEKNKEISYSEEFSTSSGEDAVVFYSIPTEIYEYEVHYVNRETGQQYPGYTNSIYFPKQPCIATIDLKKYNIIAANYDELPEIGEGILDHKLGYPETYPANTDGYSGCMVMDGNYSAVDFGVQSSTQSIEINESSTMSFEESVEISFSAGAGSGGVTVGVEGSTGAGVGQSKTTSKGFTYTATMNNMPKEAEDYGYGLSWKMFMHKGSYTNTGGNNVSFPIVDYLVTDVMTPPSVPTELKQDYQSSTPDSVALEWEYDDPSVADYFKVHRLVTTDGIESDAIAGVVDTSKGVLNKNGKYGFTFADDGYNEDGTRVPLQQGTEYRYYVEAQRSMDDPPYLSMPSVTISGYTRSDAEYPDLTVKGIPDNQLIVFPDRAYDIQTVVNNKSNFRQVSFQWQKYDGDRGWRDISKGRTDTLSFEDASAGVEGDYRCRVDAVFFSEDQGKLSTVSAYTEPFTIEFMKRSAKVDSFTVTSGEDGVPEATVTLKPSMSSCFFAPGGNVKFVIERDSVKKEYTVPLTPGTGRTSTASLSDLGDDVTALADGSYMLSVIYSGDDVFGPLTSDAEYLVVGEDVISPVLTDVHGRNTNTFAYGDTMRIDFYRYTRDENGHTIQEKLKDKTNATGYTEQLIRTPGVYNNETITAELEGVDGGAQEYAYSYTVTKRPVEIGVSPTLLYVGSVAANIPEPVLKEGYSLVGDDKPEDLASIKFWNSVKDTVITLTDNTAPGKYFAELSARADKEAFYDITLESAEIRVRPQVYDVTIKAREIDEEQAGSVRMLKPDSIRGITDTTYHYENASQVKLTAIAQTGYKFDHWEISEERTNGIVKWDDINQTVEMNLRPFNTTFEAVFVSYKFSVTVDESLSNGGKVQYPDGFENGEKYQVGTGFSFKAIKGEDVLPDHWIKQIGKRTYYIGGDTLSMTVPAADVILYPVFVGKPCKVTISGGAIATYSYINEQDKQLEKRLSSGDSVPKYSEIDLSVGEGYDHYIWYVNGKEIARDKDTSFTLEGNTDIKVVTIEEDNPFTKEEDKPVESEEKSSDVELNADVSIPLTYKDSTTYNGKKADPVKQLDAVIDLNELATGITIKDTSKTINNLISVSWYVSSKDHGNRYFYPKLALSKTAKKSSVLTSKERTKLSKLIKTANSKLKKESARNYYTVNKRSLTDGTLAVKVTMKKGAIKLTSKKKISKVKSIKMTLSEGGTITLKNGKDCTITLVDAKAGLVKVTAKNNSNFTGSVTVKVK